MYRTIWLASALVLLISPTAGAQSPRTNFNYGYPAAIPPHLARQLADIDALGTEIRRGINQPPELATDHPPVTGAPGDMVLRTTRILALEGTAPEETRARIAHSVWQLRPNGTFILHLPNARADLYPLHGRWTRSGDRLVLEARGNSSTATVSTISTTLIATIDVEKGILGLEHSTFSTAGATVYHQSRTVANSKTYRAGLAVSPR